MPDSLLLPGETVLFVTRRHLLTLLVPLLFLFLATTSLAAQACPTALELRLDGRCPLIVALGFLAAGLPLLLDWLTTRFVLTNFRLLRLQTPIWVRVESLRLPAIESLSTRVGLTGRIFGFGDVIADSSATEGGRLRLDFVPRPKELRDRIAAAIEGRESV